MHVVPTRALMLWVFVSGRPQMTHLLESCGTCFLGSRGTRGRFAVRNFGVPWLSWTSTLQPKNQSTTNGPAADKSCQHEYECRGARRYLLGGDHRDTSTEERPAPTITACLVRRVGCPVLRARSSGSGLRSSASGQLRRCKGARPYSGLQIEPMARTLR